jgi:hypothetical protein
MKKLFIVLAMCLTCQALVAQDLIKPINGKSFFAEIQSVENGIVNYQIGVSKMTMPTTDVTLIEFSEGGVQYFHEEALKQVDPNNIEAPVYKRGHKVYIPFSSKDVTQRSGALKLRELVSNGNVWEVADCKEEAHFILDFQYSEIGADGAVVNIKDRKGNQLVQTPKVKNSGWDPVQKGEEIAKAQYEKYVSKIGTGELAFDNGHLYLSGRKEGLVIRPEIGVGITESDDICLDLSGTIGYAINSYFTFGAGLDYNHEQYCEPSSVAVFANSRAYFVDKKWSPFIDLKIGYNIPTGKYDYGTEYSVRKGFIMNTMIGIQWKSFDVGLNFNMYNENHQYWEYGYYWEGTSDELCEGNSLRVAGTINVAYNFQFKKR